MRYSDLLETLVIRGPSKKCVRAFTMVELLVAMAIIGTLSAIGVPVYNNYIDNAKNSAAIVDIKKIESGILGFQTERGTFPNSLDQVGFANARDPWGRPYAYLKIQGAAPNEIQGRG